MKQKTKIMLVAAVAGILTYTLYKLTGSFTGIWNAVKAQFVK